MLLVPFHSLLLGESRLLSFPPPTKMFQFGGFLYRLVLHNLLDYVRKSDSEISGSQLTCSSPERIAACHVLHQHSVPSHPLYGVVAVWCTFSSPFSSSLRIVNVCFLQDILTILFFFFLFSCCFFHIERLSLSGGFDRPCNVG